LVPAEGADCRYDKTGSRQFTIRTIALTIKPLAKRLARLLSGNLLPDAVFPIRRIEMRSRLLLLAVICLCVFVSACGAQTEKAGPEKSVVPIKTQKNPKLRLNNEQMGDISDPSKLGDLLSRVMKERADQGVFSDGGRDSSGPALLTANGVYLVVAPDVSMGDLGKLYKVIREDCTVQIPKPSPKEKAPDDAVMMPNPLTLFLRVGTEESVTGYRQLPDLDADKKYSYDMTVGVNADADDLWLRRVNGALEILADDSVIVNESDFRGDAPAKYPPKQRPLKVSLKDEIAGLARDLELEKKYLEVIVSPSASFKSLQEILKLADEQNLFVEIHVNTVD